MLPDRSKKALIVVDVQNDFCPEGALPVPNGDKVVAPINKMIDFALKTPNDWFIVVTRDWHPATTSHFAKDGGRWPVHCVAFSGGAAFHPGLSLPMDKIVLVSKGMLPGEDAYSGFDGKTTNDVALAGLLLNCGVTSVYVCGLATDYCVKATALDALKNGFRTYLLADACRAVNIKPDDGKNAIIEMLKAGVLVTTTDFAISK